MCKICSAKTSSKHSAERHHKIVHSGETFFQCDLCPKRFALKFIRDQHQKTHNLQIIKCDVCCKDVRSIAMKKHMKAVHELKKHKDNEICNICGKSVKNVYDHVKIHEEKLQKPSQVEKCPICKKQYSFQEGKDLSMHMAKHRMAKKYQCQDCKKSFVQNGSLTIHKRIHTGEKLYSCQICSQNFSDLSTRIQHERRHTKKFIKANEMPSKNEKCTHNKEEKLWINLQSLWKIGDIFKQIYENTHFS